MLLKGTLREDCLRRSVLRLLLVVSVFSPLSRIRPATSKRLQRHFPACIKYLDDGYSSVAAPFQEERDRNILTESSALDLPKPDLTRIILGMISRKRALAAQNAFQSLQIRLIGFDVVIPILNLFFIHSFLFFICLFFYNFIQTPFLTPMFH